jgi:Recombinase
LGPAPLPPVLKLDGGFAPPHPAQHLAICAKGHLDCAVSTLGGTGGAPIRLFKFLLPIRSPRERVGTKLDLDRLRPRPLAADIGPAAAEAGRLLLSFARFEREVTSDRIRDKIAASKRKGLVGGMAPLGYETKGAQDRRGGRGSGAGSDHLPQLSQAWQPQPADGGPPQAGDRDQGPIPQDGPHHRRNPFTRGPLAHLLRNRFYIGEVAYKGKVFPGEQPAILDRDLFDAVQSRLSEQLNNHTAARAKSESLLIGRIYDDRGNRMSPEPCLQAWHQVSVLTSLHPFCMDRLGVPVPCAGCRRPRSKRSSDVPSASTSRIRRQLMTETSSAPMSSASRRKRTSWRLSSKLQNKDSLAH